MKVVVSPHDLNWVDQFDQESAVVRGGLGDNVVAIHHIGSTSIAGIHAKPVIDILVEVDSLASIDDRNDVMAAAGYTAMGEYGITGRRYFRKHNPAGVRSHHVHAFLLDSPEVERHLAFRDFMRTHPVEALAYSDLKRRLAAQHPGDITAYQDGKDPFIKDLDRLAAAWRGASHTSS